MDERRVRMSRAQQQALTRERLLAAAEKVIDRHGIGGASIDLISAEAGYSKARSIRTSKARRAVFLELLRQYMERDMAALERIVALEPDQLSPALTRWMETMDSETDCPLLVTALQLQARRSPAFAERYHGLQEKQTRTLR